MLLIKQVYSTLLNIDSKDRSEINEHKGKVLQ